MHDDVQAMCIIKPGMIGQASCHLRDTGVTQSSFCFRPDMASLRVPRIIHLNEQEKE